MILELNQIISKYYNNYYITHVINDQCIIDEKIFEDFLSKKVNKYNLNN